MPPDGLDPQPSSVWDQFDLRARCDPQRDAQRFRDYHPSHSVYRHVHDRNFTIRLGNRVCSPNSLPNCLSRVVLTLDCIHESAELRSSELSHDVLLDSSQRFAKYAPAPKQRPGDDGRCHGYGGHDQVQRVRRVEHA